MAILVVPGLPKDGRSTFTFPDVIDRQLPDGNWVTSGPPLYVLEFEHGWPWTFARRAIGYSEGNHVAWPTRPRFKSSLTSKFSGNTLALGPPADEPIWEAPLGGVVVAGKHISWTAPLAWRPGRRDLADLYWPPLVADVLIAFVLVVGATAGTERWLRRCGSLWRWRLSDLAVVVTLVAAGFGYWKWATTNRERDASIAPGMAYDERSGRSPWWEYRGPMWLARIAGGRPGLECFRRLTWAYSDLLDVATDGWPIVRGLTELAYLEIDKNPPLPSDVEALATLPKLRTLAWDAIDADVLPYLPRLRQIERLSLFRCELPADVVERLRAEMPWADVSVRRQ